MASPPGTHAVLASLVRTRQCTATAAEAEHETGVGGTGGDDRRQERENILAICVSWCDRVLPERSWHVLEAADPEFGDRARGGDMG